MALPMMMAHGDGASTTTPASAATLLQLPDECKQLLWRFFDALELCRVGCVAREATRGAHVDMLWRMRTVALLRRELERVRALRLPVADSLQRQNASRDLGLALRESRAGAEDAMLRGATVDGATFWRDCYRDFHLSLRRFDAANAAFDAAKTELQELKRQRGDLRDLLQATKSKTHGDKHLRRMQMNCIRWLNRSQRRLAATQHSRAAQSVALTKAELQEEIQAVDTTIRLQAKQLFSLRSHYQKSLHRLTAEAARGQRMLADLGEG